MSEIQFIPGEKANLKTVLFVSTAALTGVMGLLSSMPYSTGLWGPAVGAILGFPSAIWWYVWMADWTLRRFGRNPLSARSATIGRGCLVGMLVGAAATVVLHVTLFAISSLDGGERGFGISNLADLVGGVALCVGIFGLTSGAGMGAIFGRALSECVRRDDTAESHPGS